MLIQRRGVSLSGIIGRFGPAWGRGERVMGEIIRSGTIVLMGVIVMAAGVFVVFYG